MPPEEDTPLESLRDRIYQTPTKSGVEVPAYSSQREVQPYGWNAPPPPPMPKPKKRLPWTIWFLIAAGSFLLLAGAVAAFLVFHGTRTFSSDRVKVDIEAPVSIASGDTVPLVVTIHNNNPGVMTDATLFATLPDGTRAGDGTDKLLPQYNEVLGNIPAGGEVTRTVQVKLYGTEGQSLLLPFRVEYHTEGSNAVFVSKGEYSITVATSPLSVQVQTLSQTPSGQPLTLTVTIRSNASTPIENVALSAQYPSGFSVRSSDPAPTATNYFNLGTIVPGDQKIIKVTGTLIGQNDDQRVFRFTAGSANPDGTGTLGNSFASGDATVAITHPFLNVALSLNREAADMVIAEPGDTIGGLLSWQNTLTSTLANASIRVALSGNALDQSTISGGTGFYRSADSSIVFDSSTNSSLASLASGDSGAGSFTFGIKSPAALVGTKNPTVTLSVSVMGEQGTQGTTPQSLSSTLTRTVKIGTAVTLTSSLAKVSGSVPPVTGSETIYAVTLSSKNTVNSVGAAKVVFQLPSYVRWTGTSDPAISYNESTRTVFWTVGDLQPSGAASAKFQIGITPSASQTGSSPILINDQSFAGVDRFTGQQIYASAPALTTELQGSKDSGTVK